MGKEALVVDKNILLKNKSFQGFLSNQVKMTAIRPDNITVVNTFTGNSEPYDLTINTHTGHNGLMHFDVDNVVFCSEVAEPPTPSLEERLSALEQRVSDLEENMSNLEQESQDIWERVSILERFMDKIKRFIKNLPHGLRRNWIE